MVFHLFSHKVIIFAVLSWKRFRQLQLSQVNLQLLAHQAVPVSCTGTIGDLGILPGGKVSQAPFYVIVWCLLPPCTPQATRKNQALSSDNFFSTKMD